MTSLAAHESRGPWKGGGFQKNVDEILFRIYLIGTEKICKALCRRL